MTDTITRKLADALRECLGHIPDDETRRGLKALSALSEFDAEAHCDRSCTWLDHAPDCKIGGSAQEAAAPGVLTDEQIRSLIPPHDSWRYEVGHDEAVAFARSVLAAAQPHAPAPAAEPVYDSSVVRRLATQMGWTPPGAVAAERERCAILVETQGTNGDYVGGWFQMLAAKIRGQSEPPAQGIPAGMVLVPIEPTPAMLAHAEQVLPGAFSIGDEYRAMLSAAMAAQGAEGGANG